MRPTRTARSRAALVAAPLACLLAACSPARGPVPAPGNPPPTIIGDSVEGSCDDKAAASFIGRSADAATVSGAKQAAGARGVRVIRPGMAVTMDHRPGRLNLHLDDRGRITRITCG